MFYTNEYTVLYDNNGDKDVTIKPNVPFKAFEGDYTASSFARIKSVETEEIIVEIMAGANIKGVGKVKKKRTKKKED